MGEKIPVDLQEKKMKTDVIAIVVLQVLVIPHNLEHRVSMGLFPF